MQAAGRTWDVEVSHRTTRPGPSVSDLLLDLEALRARLRQAPEWFSRPQEALRAGALAEEVKRLCRESSRSSDPVEIAALLAGARKCLDELQALLGSH
jgi:hypothetical protein